MKTALKAAGLFLAMTLLTGIFYPLLITGAAQLFFDERAGGSLIMKEGKAVGSKLVGQNFNKPEYFWPRPSAIDYNPLPSSGSNLGPTSGALKEKIDARRTRLQAEPGEGVAVPVDLLCASGSGLDPHISPEAASYQVERIVRARGLDGEAQKGLLLLIDEHTEARTFGLFGEPRVNVLKLNLALDSLAHARP
jgi:K+-transporting ATPase ATPase C chain